MSRVIFVLGMSCGVIKFYFLRVRVRVSKWEKMTGPGFEPGLLSELQCASLMEVRDLSAAP